MIIGIDPTVDFAFKRLLGSPDHTKITVHFLNAVLGGAPRITQVTIIDPCLEKDFEDDKRSILDVLAIDEFGRQFDVEMQSTLPMGMSQRLAYYTSSMYVEQLVAGEDYPELRPAISICVLDAVMFPNVPDMHLDFRLRERRHGLSLTDDLQIHTIELPKYRPPGENEAITNAIEQWAYFLRFASTSTAADLSSRLGDDAFAEAVGVLEMISRTPDERALYKARLKLERDERGRMLGAEQEGIAKGELIGEQRGKQIGKQIGEQVGEQVGTIHAFQQFLGLSETARDELAAMDLAELKALATDLQTRFLSRE